jgi:hypothetical protein
MTILFFACLAFFFTTFWLIVEYMYTHKLRDLILLISFAFLFLCTFFKVGIHL